MPGIGRGTYRSAAGVILLEPRTGKVGGDATAGQFRDLILDEDTSTETDLVVLTTDGCRRRRPTSTSGPRGSTPRAEGGDERPSSNDLEPRC